MGDPYERPSEFKPPIEMTIQEKLDELLRPQVADLGARPSPQPV
jgi:hypothetical protein